jgi:hypothetical protein
MIFVIAKRKMMKRILVFALPLLLLVSCEMEDTNEFTDVRDRFVGDWLVEENSNISGQSDYVVTISYDESDETKVLINNFYNLGTTFSASGVVSTTDEESISIANQEIDGFYLQGSGSLSSSFEMNFDYTADDGVEIDSLQAVFMKQ